MNVTPFVGVWIETVNSLLSLLLVVSHPSWVCGLKPNKVLSRYFRKYVTPFVGVWIETFGQCQKKARPAVTPFVGVWIETSYQRNRHTRIHVTPFVGVWIETCNKYRFNCVPFVTPFVGVWIETPLTDITRMYLSSHPSWVCGLKHISRLRLS